MTAPDHKPIRFSAHALKRCRLRGTSPAEVEAAIRHANREPAEKGRWMYRYNLEYNARWYGRFYQTKQVAPVVAERPNEYVVVTVYTFFFSENVP